MRIAMVGAGYVGLVSGACFADFGHSVTCVDVDPDRIAALREGRMPIHEPGLEALVASNVAANRLSFATDLAPAVAAADIVFIAVGTPSRRGDGYADLSYVHAAAEAIARAVDGFTLVVTKSTVPVGTGDEVERIIRAANSSADVEIVSNPEFLREGAAIDDFKHPDRIVIGIENERARAPMAELYRPLGETPVVFTSRRTAELAKYSANAFLAMKVTFINEIADLAEKAGANIDDVARVIGLDARIGSRFLRAGPGYGGSCLPKDTRALVRTAQDLGEPLRLIETTITVNDERKQDMSRKVVAGCGGEVRGKTVALLGLTFKPDTDDVRESPALILAAALQQAGANVVAHDPEGMDAAKPLLPGVTFAVDAYDAADGADALVIVTEWDTFRSLDLKRLKAIMRTPVFVDLRNIYRRREVEALGFAYDCIGRPATAPGAAN